MDIGYEYESSRMKRQMPSKYEKMLHSVNTKTSKLKQLGKPCLTYQINKIANIWYYTVLFRLRDNKPYCPLQLHGHAITNGYSPQRMQFDRIIKTTDSYHIDQCSTWALIYTLLIIERLLVMAWFK